MLQKSHTFRRHNPVPVPVPVPLPENWTKLDELDILDKNRAQARAQAQAQGKDYAMKKVETTNAPKALGPYSQGIVLSQARPLVFVSGQLPIDPKTGKLIEGDIKALTKQVIDNLEAVLKEGGSRLDLVLRTDVFLKDLKDFASMNEEYAKRFTGSVAPARQTIQAAALPMGSLIEISCIAALE
jgi:2-iminobutanoate/2-iminopropanoate deaminase